MKTKFIFCLLCVLASTTQAQVFSEAPIDFIERFQDPYPYSQIRFVEADSTKDRLYVVDAKGIVAAPLPDDALVVMMGDMILADNDKPRKLRKKLAEYFNENDAFLFTMENIRFRYADYGYYWAQGPFLMHSIGGYELATELQGDLFVESPRDSTAAILTCVFHSPKTRDWYMFRFEPGLLASYSSNPEFNRALSELSDDERLIDMGSGKFFQIGVANPAIYDFYYGNGRKKIRPKTEEFRRVLRHFR